MVRLTLLSVIAPFLYAFAAWGQVAKEVNVDLGGAAFTQVLPFDVPFNISGEILENVMSVEVRYLPFAGIQESDARWSEAPKGEWLRQDTGDHAKRFHIHMPTVLEPDQNYTFRFTIIHGPSALERAQFRVAAANLVRAKLKIMPVEQDTAATENVRSGFASQFITLMATGVKIVPGSLFDTNTITREIKNLFIQTLVPALDPQDKLRIKETEYAIKVNDLQLFLQRISEDTSLHRLVTALDTGRKDPNISAFLKEFPDLFVIASLDRKKIEVLSQGYPAGHVIATSVGNITNMDEIRKLQENYRILDNQISEFRKSLLALFPMTSNRIVIKDSLIKNKAIQAAHVSNLQSLASDGSGMVWKASTRAKELGSLMRNIVDLTAKREVAVAALVDRMTVIWIRHATLSSSTISSYDLERKNYISADAGLIWAPDLGRVVPYAGTNIYFRPINNDAPLPNLFELSGFLRRFALMVGLTVGGIEDAARGRENLVKTSAGLVGAGLRITRVIRIGGGAIIFMARKETPFNNEKKAVADFYASISFDINVAETPLGRWLSP